MTKANGTQSLLFSVRGGLLIASLLLAGSFTLVLLSPDVISKQLALRLQGVMLGALGFLYANAVPKVLPRVVRGDAAAEQAMRRFTGWSLALGSAGYMLAWILAPIEQANLLAMAFLGGAHLVVIARCLLRRSRRSRI
jgi:hypothetical protein